MSLKCFYVLDGAAAGPVSPDELTALAAAGTVSPDSLVWIEGTPDWQSFDSWAAGLSAESASRERSVPIIAPTPDPVAETKFPPASIPSGESIDPTPAAMEEEIPAKEKRSVRPSPPSQPARENHLGDGKLHRILARISLITLLVVIALRVLGRFAVGGKLLKPLGTVVPLGPLGLLGLGLATGLLALFGLRRSGRAGIRTPALIGLAGCAFFSFLLTSQFIRNRQRFRDFALEARVGDMLPVQTAPEASRILHPTLGFSLDVPAGFAEFPSSTIKAWKVFRKIPEPGMLAEIFGVQPLGNMLPRRHLDPNEIQGEFTGTISRTSWRGVKVDVIRFFETKDEKDYVTYNIQIPLKGEAIQLSLGAPAQRETELKARIEAILASLDGPSDW